MHIFFTVPLPSVDILPLSIQGDMVGSEQEVHCTVGTVSGVEMDSVMISWTGPGGDAITTDSRVTISATTSSGNDYISTLQFAYLMEGDEGMYTCSVMILETSASGSIMIQNLVGKDCCTFIGKILLKSILHITSMLGLCKVLYHINSD